VLSFILVGFFLVCGTSMLLTFCIVVLCKCVYVRVCTCQCVCGGVWLGKG